MSDAPVRHEERPHAGTRVAYTLTRDGLAIEEFTSGVKTYEDIVYYDEVWDSYRTHHLPRGALWLLAVLSAAWTALLALLPGAWLVCSLPGGLLVAAWIFFLVRVRVLTVQLFNYDGNEIAALRGVPGEPFRSFLEGLDARLTSGRYPIQSVFEGLDLGRCEWQGFGRSWLCRFVYDRVVVERRWWLGWEHRVYYSLMALEPPVRLAWRLPRAAFWGTCLAFVAAVALALEAAGEKESALWPWAGALAVAGLLGLLGSLAGLSVAVIVGASGQTVRSAYLPWWQKVQRQEILRWFARLIRLADRLSEIDHEDYWEYHRNKLAILNEEGFLDPWPYRSALARLNSQEREEQGE